MSASLHLTALGAGVFLASLFLATTGLSAQTKSQVQASPRIAVQTQSQSFRVIAYNVMFGGQGSVDDFSQALAPYHPDILLLSEVPGGDWAKILGHNLQLPYVYLGEISSANHKDKYKAILSRTPLESACEIPLTTGTGWKPASALRAVTRIGKRAIALYTLHIANSGDNPGQAQELVSKALGIDSQQDLIIGGDFNLRAQSSGLTAIQSGGHLTSAWTELSLNPQDQSSIVGQAKNGLIDHVFFKSKVAVQVKKGGVLELPKAISDHHPVYVDFQWSNTDQTSPVEPFSCPKV